MIKDLKKLLFYNFKTLMSFSFGFRLSSLIIFTPLFFYLFRLIMKLMGYSYLTYENTFKFLLNPLTIFFILILLLLMLVYSIIDISTIIIILDASKQNKKITIREALNISIPKSFQVFNLKNIIFIFLVLFLIPFFNFGVNTSFITSIDIPNFIISYIKSKSLFNFIFIILEIVLLIILLRLIYAIHYYILEDNDFKTSREKSIDLSKKYHLKDFISLVSLEVIIFIIYLFFIYLGILLIYFIHLIFTNILVESLFITIVSLFSITILLVLIGLSTPLSFAVLSNNFYKYKTLEKEKIKHINFKEKNVITKRNWQKFKLSLIILIFISTFIFTYNLIKGNIKLDEKKYQHFMITAHRGSSKDNIENTMSAFFKAQELNADYIEIDVRLTKDLEVVIIHDNSLKRTHNINKNIDKIDYQEIKNKKVNNKENSEVPKLKDVLHWAKSNNIKLNIELKGSNEIILKVLDLVNKENYFENVVIAASNYDYLKIVKEYNKNIKTVYVTSILYGNINSLEYADCFSLEETIVTKKLVNQIHSLNKEIYVWTINSKEKMIKMMELNVDNIITDDVELAKKVNNEISRNILNDYIKFLENLIA